VIGLARSRRDGIVSSWPVGNLVPPWPVGHERLLIAAKIAAQLVRVVVVDRTRMRQCLGNAELAQFIDDLTRLDFELPRQLIDSDLTHV
jgi:hypothetical protein